MRNSTSVSGFLNILKPSGPTSSDIAVSVKKLLNAGKVGHMGTLDPLAAGVLPIALGKAARLFDYLTTYKTKKYRAVFTFGTGTDTADSAGKIIQTGGKIPCLFDIEKILKHFTGKITQVPPKYSAIKIKGQKAYDLARSGADFELAGREITIYSLTVADCGKKSFTFDIECSGGTYIRSLCTDIAKSLGTIAYMSMLIRLQSGFFEIADSVTMQELESCQNPLQNVISAEKVLSGLKRYDVEDKYYKNLCNGVPILSDSCDEDNILLYCKGEFFGIGKISDNRIYIKTYLRENEGSNFQFTI